jgi:hypothetical protein
VSEQRNDDDVRNTQSECGNSTHSIQPFLIGMSR